MYCKALGSEIRRRSSYTKTRCSATKVIIYAKETNTKWSLNFDNITEFLLILEISVPNLTLEQFNQVPYNSPSITAVLTPFFRTRLIRRILQVAHEHVQLIFWRLFYIMHMHCQEWSIKSLSPKAVTGIAEADQNHKMMRCESAYIRSLT